MTDNRDVLIDDKDIRKHADKNYFTDAVSANSSDGSANSSDNGVAHLLATDENRISEKADRNSSDSISSSEKKSSEVHKVENTNEQINTAVEEAIVEQHVSHRNRTISVVIILIVIVLTLLSAFVWPGWAMKTASQNSSNSNGQEVVVPVDPVPLATGATDFQKILPQTINHYARGSVKPVTVWESSTPIEEYEVIYKNGDEAANIELTCAQWSSSQYANEQYQSLLSNATGPKIASGKISVGSKDTGMYEIHENADNPKQSIVIWQNDTAVFRAIGPRNAVNNFYSSFPY